MSFFFALVVTDLSLSNSIIVLKLSALVHVDSINFNCKCENLKKPMLAAYRFLVRMPIQSPYLNFLATDVEAVSLLHWIELSCLVATATTNPKINVEGVTSRHHPLCFSNLQGCLINCTPNTVTIRPKGYLTLPRCQRAGWGCNDTLFPRYNTYLDMVITIRYVSRYIYYMLFL